MAKVQNDTIDAGANYSMIVSVFTDETNTAAMDLTGYTARMMLRSSYGAASPAISLTSPGGGLSINGTAGQITVTMTASQTSLLTGPAYVYDLEIVSGSGAVARALQGTFLINPEATK